MSVVWVLNAVWLLASRNEQAHRTLFICRLKRRCSFHGCAAPVFPTRDVVSLPCPNLSSLQSPRGIAGGVPRHARGPTRLGAL
ncbi:hypothetical protein S83_032311 [Arachis hypogaea]